MRISTIHGRRQALGVTLTAALVAGACAAPLKLAHDDSEVVLTRQLLTAPNPSQPGSFGVKTLYYGSGTDKQRAVYRDSVTLKTAKMFWFVFTPNA